MSYHSENKKNSVTLRNRPRSPIRSPTINPVIVVSVTHIHVKYRSSTTNGSLVFNQTKTISVTLKIRSMAATRNSSTGISVIHIHVKYQSPVTNAS